MPAAPGTRFCNYGPACATLQVRGVDVGSILIKEGLARRSWRGLSRRRLLTALVERAWNGAQGLQAAPIAVMSPARQNTTPPDLPERLALGRGNHSERYESFVPRPPLPEP